MKKYQRYKSENNLPMINVGLYNMQIKHEYADGKGKEHWLILTKKENVAGGTYMIAYVPEDSILYFYTLASTDFGSNDDSDPVRFYLTPDFLEDFISRFLAGMDFSVSGTIYEN